MRGRFFLATAKNCLLVCLRCVRGLWPKASRTLECIALISVSVSSRASLSRERDLLGDSYLPEQMLHQSAMSPDWSVSCRIQSADRLGERLRLHGCSRHRDDRLQKNG